VSAGLAARLFRFSLLATLAVATAGCGSKYETPLGVGRDRDDYRASPCRRAAIPGARIACFEIEQAPAPAGWRERMIETLG
jgi:hypothetical protein